MMKSHNGHQQGVACGSGKWNRRDFIKAAGVSTAAAMGGFALLSRYNAHAGNVVRRPISEFVEAQGTTMEFVPPVGDFVAWLSVIDQLPVLGASVDYAGLAASYLLENDIDLGTATRGSVIERPVGDGLAEVQVLLETVNALTWAIEFDPTSEANQFGENELLFGFRAQDLVIDPTLPPALGRSEFQVVYRKPFGAPVPDLTRDLFVDPDPDLELIAISFYADAAGPLHELAGLGPDGTPARCTVTQTGVLARSKFMGATADGFPAERVELRVVGQ